MYSGNGLISIQREKKFGKKKKKKQNKPTEHFQSEVRLSSFMISNHLRSFADDSKQLTFSLHERINI